MKKQRITIKNIFLFFLFLFNILIFFNINSFANEFNWIYMNKNWYMLDDLGNLVYNKWVVYNNEEYHLSLDGIMDTNKWIDDIYYVDSTGKKLRNTYTPDGYYVNEYGIYDKNIPRKNLINPIDINAPVSSIINASGIANSNNLPSVNNNIYPSNNNTQSYSNHYGFRLSIVGYNEDNSYYGRNDYKSHYKTIIVQMTYENENNNYFLNTQKLENLNDSLETVCDGFEEDALNALRDRNIKKYYINKAELTKFSYTNIVITFSGYITFYDNKKSNLKYRFVYYPYDEYYTFDEI